jgi:hypothetical protein
MKTMEQEPKDQDPSPNEHGVSFGGGGHVAAVGALSGMAIAIGVPWVLLANGQSLGAPVLTTLIIVALCAGGLVSLVSAFFGLVIPRRVHGRWMDPERWRKFAAENRRWKEERHRWKKAWRDGVDLDDADEDEPGPAKAEAAPRRPRRRQA